MHIRVNHPVTLWTGKQKPEATNDRLVRLGWKGNTKTGREAHSARCFSVPVWQPQLQGMDDAFLEMLIDAFENAQKQIAHKYVTDMLDSNGGVCNDIPAAMLSPAAVLAWFSEQDASDDSSRGKLNGAQIREWFDVSTLRKVIEAKVAERNGYLKEGYEMTDKEMKSCEQAANGYCAVFERLAAPSPKVDKKIAESLKAAMLTVWSSEEDINTDLIGKKVLKKIESIINPPAEKDITLAML